jgi:signal transduction histidine kinase
MRTTVHLPPSVTRQGHAVSACAATRQAQEHFAELHFAVGLFCSVVGAEALVVPSRFSIDMLAPWAVLMPLTPVWGSTLLLSGGLLIAAATLRLPRWVQIVAGAWSALLLLALASLRVADSEWADSALYAVLALGIAVESLHPGEWRASQRVGQLSVVLAAGSFAAGVMLALTAARPPFNWYAVPLGVGGVVVLLGLHPRCGRYGRGLAQLACAIGLVAYGVQVPLPQHDWTGVALYVGLGAALALMCLVRGRLRDATATSLRVRLVLTLIGVASVPLIIATTAIAAAAEAAAIRDALADQQIAAVNLARTLAQFDDDYRGLVSTIAARGGLAGLPAGQQREILLGLVATDVYAFSTYDALGQPSTRTDDKAGVALLPTLAAEIGSSGAAVSAPGIVPNTDRAEIVFAAPLHAADGSSVGFVAAEIESSQLSADLKRLGPAQLADASVFIVDRDDRVVIHSGSAAPLNATAEAWEQPLPAIALARTAPGSVQYRTGGVSYLAGFAPVPVLNWVVVATYPAASILAGVRAGRETAFGILVLAATASAVIGGLVAERFVRPLSALGTAAERLSIEEVATALPQSSFAEVQRLASSFSRMRERLAMRTADREEALAAARDATQVREDFLSIAAHEMKTPVAALRGQTQLLRLRLGTRVLQPGQLDDSLRRIDLQSHKLERLIEQLLDLARLERQTVTLDMQPVDLGGLVEEVVSVHPHSKRIAVRLPETDQTVHVDRLRLEQVLNNLIDNAVKFSPDGGEVSVSVEAIDNWRVRITVLDHGIGIPPEYRARIFERFHQAHGASHRSGLGLGLYLTRQIVELHGGTIGLEFPTSGETRFMVELPSVPAPSRIVAIAS